MEFDLINQYFAPLSGGIATGDKAIGDDAAVMMPKPNHQIVTTTDTMVEGVHFFAQCDPYRLGWKLLAVNLSDLAAMGAQPWCYSLALTLPKSIAKNESWLQGFTQGLSDLAAQQACPLPLIGGDTTKGPLTLTLSIQGQVPVGQALYRTGAQVGDLLVVTNTIGDGALGLQVALQNPQVAHLTQAHQVDVLRALEQPMPQNSLASQLYGVVNAVIDISDGLVQDLGHLLRGGSLPTQEGLGAVLELQNLPQSAAMQAYTQVVNDYSLILSGGDDYQLLMAVSADKWQILQAIAQDCGVVVSQVGQIVAGQGVRLFNQGVDVTEQYQAKGYQHF